MKLILVLIITSLTYSTSNTLLSKWQNFKKVHQKSYHNGEEPNRLNIFADNLKKIEEHNKIYEKNEASYRMGVNQFADLTSEEFFQNVLSDIRVGFLKTPEAVKVSEIPDAIDWREKGAVTDVKNQNNCAAWSYSVTGVLEGQNFLKTDKLIALSEQELADCASDFGCSGGAAEEGYYYVMQHGLSSAEDYPSGTGGTCHRGSIPSAVTENGYVLLVGNERALREAVGTVGPVAVAVDASSWQLYSSGILGCQKSATLNHGVLVVGYAIEESEDYWLVKNSWGTFWGEDGYIRVARRADEDCGVTLAPTYPVL